MNRQILRICFFSAFVALASCGNSSTQAAHYAPPTPDAAFDAYKIAMKSDWIDQPLEIKPWPKEVNARTHVRAAENNRRVAINKKAPLAYKALRAVESITCEWGRFNKWDVPLRAKTRIIDPPSRVYYCQFEIRYSSGADKPIEAHGIFFSDSNMDWANMGLFTTP